MKQKAPTHPSPKLKPLALFLAATLSFSGGVAEAANLTTGHVSALEKLKVISKNETKKINQGLNGILNDYQKGKIKFSKKNEDSHMNLEYFLHQRIGDHQTAIVIN